MGSTTKEKLVNWSAYEKLPLPLPSEPAVRPPLKARLLITVEPLLGMVREASRENLSNVTDDKLGMLNDEPVSPVSCSVVASFVRERFALMFTGTANKKGVSTRNNKRPQAYVIITLRGKWIINRNGLDAHLHLARARKLKSSPPSQCCHLSRFQSMSISSQSGGHWGNMTLTCSWG